MAWVCIRCERKIYAPRKGARGWAMRWRYSSKTEDLTVDMASLHKINRRGTVTHLYCEAPEVEGFKERMQRRLKMPVSRDHPLLM